MSMSLVGREPEETKLWQFTLSENTAGSAGINAFGESNLWYDGLSVI